MNKRLIILMVGIIFMSIFLLFLFLIFVYNQPKEKDFECKNMSLSDTSNCLKDRLKTIYNYKITEDNSKRGITDVVFNGGDCYDYTRMYIEWANKRSH